MKRRHEDFDEDSEDSFDDEFDAVEDESADASELDYSDFAEEADDDREGEEQAERVYAERPNKSLRKRELAAVSELVETLARLGSSQIAEAPLDDQFREQLRQFRRMKPSGARRRQQRYLTGLLDGEPAEAVRGWLAAIEQRQLAEARSFHEVEAWRDRLLERGDEALSQLLDRYPLADRQLLRQATRDARREQDTGKPAGARRKLFRLLRDLLAEGSA